MISLVATIYTAAEGSVVFLGRTGQTASPGAMLAKGGLLRPGDSEIEHSPALNDRYCQHAETETDYFDLTSKYSFFWRTNGMRTDRTRPEPSAPPRTLAAHGAGRSFIFVILEWDLIILRPLPALDGSIHMGSVRRGA